MSSYRTYVPWNKNVGTNYTSSTTSKTEATPAKSKYDTNALPKPKTEAKEDATEKSGTTKLGSGYRSSGTYGAYPRDTSVGRDASAYSNRGEVTNRFKPATEKKECPPVSYRNLNRTTGTRSRDPSPAERDKTDNYRLYNRSNYARSVSRDPEPVTGLKYAGPKATESKEDINTIASRYAGRTSRDLSKEEPPRYSGRSSIKEELTNRYGGRASRAESKEDLTPKFTSRLSRADSKDDTPSPRYRSASRVETKEEITPRYGRSTSRVDSKEDIPRYGRSTSRVDSKEDIPSRYGTRKTSVSECKDESTSKLAKPSLRSSRDDLSSSLSSNSLSKYSVSRHPSREDVTSSSKYINSRFLPKNTIEKSYNSYSKPSSLRSSNIEERRRNRDTMLSILNSASVKSAAASRNEDRITSPTPIEPTKVPTIQKTVVKPEEMETVSVVTRGTSPTPPSQTSYCRTRRADMARVIEKEIKRPKYRGEMLDKEMQSDRLDDTARYSRYGSSSTVAAPWSSYLDLKFNSPRIAPASKFTKTGSGASSKENSQSSRSDKPEPDKSNETLVDTEKTPDKVLKKPSSEKGSTESVNSITRNSSSKSISQKSKQASESKARESSKSKSPSPSSVSSDSSKKSFSTPKSKSPETSNKKQLPPQVPKSESPAKTTGSLHSLNTPNKDFRKSVLNMNTDGKLSKKSSKRTNSASSDSEPSSTGGASEVVNAQTNDSTTISSKFSSLQSLPKTKSSSSSKVPLKLSIKIDKEKEPEEKSRRSKTRSPSVSSESSSSSSSDEDIPKSKSNKKKLQSAGSSRTSMLLSSADELSLDRPSKPPPSPRVKTEGPKTEAEAKSFLMRALAPVTNFFKVRHQDSGDKSAWLDSTSEEKKSDEKPKKALIKRIESGDKAWWLEDTSEVANSTKEPSVSQSTEPEKKVYKIRKIESGNLPWWLTENGEVPEGVVVYSNGNSLSDKYDGRKLYKIRKQESGQVEWWMDNTDSTDTSKSTSKKQSEFVNTQKIRHIDSGERSWWANSTDNIPEIKEEEPKEETGRKLIKLIKPQSGERAWWLMSHPDIPEGVVKLDSDSSDSESDTDKHDEPLGDRASPEGLETPREPETENQGRLTPYDNVPTSDGQKPKRPTHIPLFISHHTNIDEILGGANQMLSPLMDRIFVYQNKPDDVEEVDATQVRIHDSTAQRPVIQPARIDVVEGAANDPEINQKLDDAALQLYKDGDYGSYLDLEASISEQQEEFDGFQTNKKNSIVLRTQLSVRVHTIIEKLLTSEGRELRRALFSLKQIFQEDKDLVHEFVQNDGLACLIKVGSEADQNYQNYILRALGQVMLYVDGMNGVMEHNQTVQWLYTLIASKFRLVVKTALKLLLVFVEYTDSNCMLLIKAVNAVDSAQGLMAWSNIMRLLKDFNSADTELLIYAMTLVNKCLNGIPDQDTYYDQTDALEEQGIEGIIQRYMSKQGTDLDLLQQFQIYEAVLQHEDGEDKGFPLRHLDENIRKTLRNRKSMVDSAERRRSRRHSTGTTPQNNNNNNKAYYSLQSTVDDEDESSSSQSSGPNDHNLNGSYKDNNKAMDAGVTPALRRRRERAERQRSFIREQQESAAIFRASLGIAEDAENGNYTNNIQQKMSNGNLQLSRNSSKKDFIPLMNAVNKLDSSEEGILKKPWVLSMMYGKNVDDSEEINDNNADTTNENERKVLMQLKRENTVKDLTQKLASQNILHSPSDENKINRIGDMSGLISKAKEGLAKSKSKADVLKSPTAENVPKVIEVKKSENELRWEELVHSLDRPLNLCDMDFTDLKSEDEVDILAPIATTNGIPPPPPPFIKDSAPPPPPISSRNPPPPFPTAPAFPSNLQRPQRPCAEPTKTNSIKKNKKTVKLFWKEVRDDPIAITKLEKLGGMIWDELNPVTIDTQKLEHLFESRAKDLITKEKQQEMNKNKEIIVLDHKRSNAINIGMTKLPPPRSIKTAILKMDATIMNREGIEKLLTMLPTEEERTKIQDAQAANPDLPLGSAEQFLLTLASISELPARLKLWAFKLDFENSEREIAEPLMDLKQGVELLRANKTFRGILSTLLSIGIFLNGTEVKGFQIEYLAKVPEVKDTVHKHSLLHHLCHIVMEKFPEASDLYSEIGAITRASKIDFDELALNIQRLESDCKASWDHLKLIAKHDGSTMMKVKMSDFLADCAERIILLGIVHRRVMNRYHKFLLWMGIPLHRVADSKPNEFCRIVSEFALEYRTTRERVLQQLEKKANHRERNKTRGKMITEVGKFRTKEDRADAELRQLLGSDISDVESLQGTLPWRRQRSVNSSIIVPNGNLTDDGDDEILESLVKTATKAPSARATPRERKRTRHADRKSLKRSRTRENNPFGGSRDSP